MVVQNARSQRGTRKTISKIRCKKDSRREKEPGRTRKHGLGLPCESVPSAVDYQICGTHAADPAASSWKTLLDSFLLEDDEGNVKFTEGRAVFFCKLNNGHKTTLLSDIPKRAHYIRAVSYTHLRAHET